MSRMHLLFLGIALLGAFSANAQVCSYPDQITSSGGTPCSYTYSAQSSGGEIGCWATASCRNSVQLAVSFYQYWTCTNGFYVSGSGSSVQTDSAPTYCSISGNWETYKLGVSAGATAQVYGYDGYDFEAGWDDQDCDGGESYSGPFSYNC